MGNLITPCPVRDHYREAYRLVTEFKAKPVDINAENAISDAEYRRRMTAYGDEITSLTEMTWRRDYLGLKAPSEKYFPEQAGGLLKTARHR